MTRLRLVVVATVLAGSIGLAPAALAQGPPDTAPPSNFVPATDCQGRGENFGEYTTGRLPFVHGEEPGPISHGAAGHCLGLFPVG